jgi:integrase
MIQEEARVKAGDKWQQNDFIFTSGNGRPLHPETLTDHHRQAMERAGLTHVRYHDLRHTAATLLIAQGVPMKFVQKILGHSSFKVTMDTYAHVLPSMLEDAAQVMEDLLTPQTPLLHSVVAHDPLQLIQ